MAAWIVGGIIVLIVLLINLVVVCACILAGRISREEDSDE